MTQGPYINVGEYCHNNPSKFYIHSPTFQVDEIGVSLSRLPRYLGHGSLKGASMEWVYSVLHHSLLVADCAVDEYPDRPDVELCALLHDAAEAFVGDLPAPWSSLPEFHGFKAMAHRIQMQVFDAFGLDRRLADLIKPIDQRIVHDEMTLLFGQRLGEGLGIHIEPLSKVELVRRFRYRVAKAQNDLKLTGG